MRYSHLFLAAALLLPFGLAAPLHAQIRLEGTILDNETGMPIPGALVEVLDDRRRGLGERLTGEDGAFEFEVQKHGGYLLRAARLGYQKTITPVLWTDGHDYLQVEVRLDPHAILLAPVEITAWSAVRPSPVLANFRDRMRSGIGHFFTREDIERIRPIYVSDVVARVPGVRVAGGGIGNRRKIYMSRARGTGRDCPAQIFIDGFLINRRSKLTGEDFGFTLDDAISPGSVEGIEVYKGLSTVPAQFMNEHSRCGVVAVWTRRGDLPG